MRSTLRVLLRTALLLPLLLAGPTSLLAQPAQYPLPSMHGYSGLWDMPSARLLPDWTGRLAGSTSGPYSALSAGLGVFDRLELYGQLTEVDTLPGFPGQGFGDYKDRLAGLKLLLWREDDDRTHLALGWHDVTGTGLFQSRYLALSHRLGPLDLTAGLGQGVMGGEAVDVDFAEDSDQERTAANFQKSLPWRRTRPFAGLQWRLRPGLWLVAEWSSIDYDRLFGYRDEPLTPLNAGLKAKPWPWLDVSAGLMRGRDLAASLAVTFPLDADGLFPLERKAPYQPLEKRRAQASRADDAGLVALVAVELAGQGFRGVKVRAGDGQLSVEAENGAFQGDGRALARMAAVADGLAPPRIERFRLALTRLGRPTVALATERRHLRDYLESRLDDEGFLAFADLGPGGPERRGANEMADGSPDGLLGDLADDWTDGWAEGAGSPVAYATAHAPEDRLALSVEPRLRTFLENREGFFKTKAFLAPALAWVPWRDGLLQAEAEVTLYNNLDELAFPSRERESAATDLGRYENGRGTRLTTLALSQLADLPWRGLGRITAGYLDTSFAGLGGEAFRFFGDDRFGLGLEAAAARKRDPEGSFGLDQDSERLFWNGFVNLYAQVWSEQGVDMELKLGRFLGGDPGGRLEVRRTMGGWTVGLWYALSDASGFRDPDNRAAADKGVFVRIPLSFFSGRESPSSFRYALGSFTSDQGRVLRQPMPLVPADMRELPAFTRSRLGEMRAP